MDDKTEVEQEIAGIIVTVLIFPSLTYTATCTNQQECIPVRRIPPTLVAITRCQYWGCTFFSVDEYPPDSRRDLEPGIPTPTPT